MIARKRRPGAGETPAAPPPASEPPSAARPPDGTAGSKPSWTPFSGSSDVDRRSSRTQRPMASVKAASPSSRNRSCLPRRSTSVTARPSTPAAKPSGSRSGARTTPGCEQANAATRRPRRAGASARRHSSASGSSGMASSSAVAARSCHAQRIRPGARRARSAVTAWHGPGGQADATRRRLPTDSVSPGPLPILAGVYSMWERVYVGRRRAVARSRRVTRTPDQDPGKV